MRIFTLIVIVFSSCSSPDCGFALKEFDKDSTLELKSYVHDANDCGEWGGHSEHIAFSRFGKKYKLAYRRDTSDCIMPRLKERPGFDSVTEKELIVSEDKIVMTMHYISKLNNHSPSWNSESNAPNHYSVKFRNSHKEVEVIIYDSDNSWTSYDRFKNELL